MAIAADRLGFSRTTPREVWLTFVLSVVLHLVLTVAVVLGPKLHFGRAIEVPPAVFVDLIPGGGGVGGSPPAAPSRATPPPPAAKAPSPPAPKAPPPPAAKVAPPPPPAAPPQPDDLTIQARRAPPPKAPPQLQEIEEPSLLPERFAKARPERQTPPTPEAPPPPAQAPPAKPLPIRPGPALPPLPRLPEPLPPLQPLPQQAGPPVAAVRPPAVTPPQAAPPQAAPPNGGGAGEKENIEVVGGGGSGPGGTALSSYLALLDWKIQSNWVALASAAKVTIVRFRVLRSGQVRDIAVEQSSGDASADDAAIRAIRLSVPLPPFPNLMTEPQLTLLYRFNLQQQG